MSDLTEITRQLGNKITRENIHLFREKYQQLSNSKKISFGWGWLLETAPVEKEITTYIYVLYSKKTKRVKIGRSINPEQRIRAIETQSGEELETLCFKSAKPKLEQELHQKFKQHRVIGEWFALTKPQIQLAIDIITASHLDQKQT